MSRTECWMCDEEEIKYISEGKERIYRLLDTDNKTFYTIVPREPLLKGHIMIIRKFTNNNCRKNLIEAKEDDLQVLNKSIIKWTKILKFAFSDCRNVFLTCLCDKQNVHLHYHLFPVRSNEKPDKGQGHIWLGRLEKKVVEQKPDIQEISLMVDFLNNKKEQFYYQIRRNSVF